MNGLLLLTANRAWGIVTIAFVVAVVALVGFIFVWPFLRTPQH